MRSLIVAVSLAAVALPGMALAVQAPPAPAPRPMADGALTRAEALVRADARFDTIDTDRDGRITAAERAALPQPGPRPGVTGSDASPPPPPGGQPRRGRGMGGMGGGRMLERADADRDGVITRDEFRAVAAAGFDRQDLNKDGKVDPAERRTLREQRMERRGDRADD